MRSFSLSLYNSARKQETDCVIHKPHNSDAKKTQSWAVNVFRDFFFKEKKYSALFLGKQKERLSWCDLKSYLWFPLINSLFSDKMYDS